MCRKMSRVGDESEFDLYIVVSSDDEISAEREKAGHEPLLIPSCIN